MIPDLLNKSSVKIPNDGEWEEVMAQLKEAGAVISTLERPPKKERCLWIVRFYFRKKHLEQATLL